MAKVTVFFAMLAGALWLTVTLQGCKQGNKLLDKDTEVESNVTDGGSADGSTSAIISRADECNSHMSMCTKEQEFSKGDNGCKAFAQGWLAGSNDCSSCGDTSRDFLAGTLAECNSFCEDIYSADDTIGQCKAGCAYMGSNSKDFCGEVSGSDPPSPAPSSPAPGPVPTPEDPKPPPEATPPSPAPGPVPTPEDAVTCNKNADECNSHMSECTNEQEFSKGDNGCKAFAQGWPAGSNDCSGCGDTSRDFRAGCLSECIILCTDMYNSADNVLQCQAGCAYMESNANLDCCDASPCAELTTEPIPKGWAPLPARDTQIVTGEEWNAFLQFQESRRDGFSCSSDKAKGAFLAEGGRTEGARNIYPPNAEKATFDCKLWKAAYLHAEDQALWTYCDHTGKDGSSARQRAEAVGAKGGPEHLACFHTKGADAIIGLQTSPGHCNSMAKPDFRGFAVGHGMRRDPERGDGDVWTVMYNNGGSDIEDSESCIPEGFTSQGDQK